MLKESNMLESTPQVQSESIKFDFYKDFSRVRFFRFGRHALLAALKVINIQLGDRVLVPAFICRDLLAPIHVLGAIVVFYEIGPDMKPLSLPDVPGLQAVLAVNYFGFPQDLAPFRLYCKAHDAILIEDNAHGFLSRDETGIFLGARGDLGIFSIRKTFALPDGAMMMVNKSALQGSLEPQLAFSDQTLPISFWIKRYLSWLQRKTGIALLTIGKSIARSIRYWRTGYAIAPLLPENEFEMPDNPALHRYTMSTLSKLNLPQESDRRRNLYIVFTNLFAPLNIKPVFQNLPVGTVPYGYPFYANDKAAQIATRLARKQGFDCIHWPDLPEAVAPTAPSHYQSLWMVNFTC
jgi:hypothetical protein